MFSRRLGIHVVGMLGTAAVAFSAAAAHGQQIRLEARAVRPQAVGAPAADPTDTARQLLTKTNALRQERNLPALEIDPQLEAAARKFAGTMASHDKYGHTADGHQPAERIEAAGYDYCLVAENIAWLDSLRGFTGAELATDFFRGWRNSREHLENLLDPRLQQIGIAVVRSPKTGRYYAVQEFGRPRSAEIVFEVANATAVPLHYRVDNKEFLLEPRSVRRHARCLPPLVSIPSTDPDSAQLLVQPKSNERLMVRAAEDDGLSIDHQLLPQRTTEPGTAVSTPEPATAVGAPEPATPATSAGR